MRVLVWLLLLLLVSGQAFSENEKAKEMAGKAFKDFQANYKKGDMGKILKKTKKRLNELDDEKFYSTPSKAVDKTEPAKKSRNYTMAISSSIPPQVLRTYIQQAKKEKVNLRFILRGFVEGISAIKPTINFYISFALKPEKSLADSDSLYPVEMDIDPVRFRNIKKVPALISGKCVVYGDAMLSALIERADNGMCDIVIGATYPVIEQNALQEIQKRAENIPESLFKRLVAQKEKELQNLPGADLLPPASRNATKKIHMSYELPFDVPDPKTGNTMYPAGYSYNPLDYLAPFQIEIFLINGSRKSEVEWTRRAIDKGMIDDQTVIAVLGGNYFTISEKFQRPVFSGISLLDFCSGTPCLIRKGKEENVLTIKTWKVDDDL